MGLRRPDAVLVPIGEQRKPKLLAPLQNDPRALELHSPSGVSSILCIAMVAAALGAEQPRAISPDDSTAGGIFIPPEGWDRYPPYAAPPVVTASNAQLSPTAVASKPVAAAPKSEVVMTHEPSGPRPTSLGLLVDAGLPDGAGISLAYRHWTWIRLQGGYINNTVNSGLRGGVTLLPFYSWFTPTLTLEAGHFFPGDASSIARRFSNDPNLNHAFNVGYNFENAHLGFEIGSPRRVAFFLRGGLSYVQMTADVQPMIRDSSVQAQPLRIRAMLPSVKLGLTIYFL